MRRFSVVFVSGSLHLSGSTIWLNNLVKAMEALGVPCAHVVVGREKRIKSKATYYYCTGQARKTFYIKFLRVIRLHVWWPEAYRKIENHFYCNKLNQFFTGKLDDSVLVVKDFSAPLPSFFLNARFKVVSVLHHQNKSFIANPKSRLVAVSHAVMEDSRKLGFEVNSVIYNPVYSDEIMRMANNSSPVDSEYILFVGRLIPEKGVYELLEAFVRLYKENSITHKLVFVGSGKCETELRARACRAGIQEHVVFAGFQENPYSYIKHAKLLVLPSYSEAMGYVAVEASILNTSYLVSNFSAAQEFFLESNIFDMGNSEDEFIGNLTSKMLSLLKQPQTKLHEGILEQMEPEHVAGQFLQLHNRMAS